MRAGLSFRSPWLVMCLLVLVVLSLFYWAQKQMTRPLIRFLMHDEFAQVLDQSMADQKTLANLDPAASEQYKVRFEQIGTLKNHLRVLRYNQPNLVRTYEAFFLICLAILVGSAAGIVLFGQLRTEKNLVLLQGRLELLAQDRRIEEGGPEGHGIFRRIHQMIRETASRMVQAKERLRYLEHLSAWQESARRHAHEIRTPLTAVRLELESLATTLGPELSDPQKSVWEKRKGHILEELERLNAFTRAFVSLGKLRQPQPVQGSLGHWVDEFVELYAEAWPHLTLKKTLERNLPLIVFDGEAVRQVVVNLCNNSDAAVEGDDPVPLMIRCLLEPPYLVLEIADGGPGIDPELADRIFEPYVTTRPIGEGMGLGLAISRKLMLDHGGDLVLHANGPSGVVFRLLFPLVFKKVGAA